MTEIARELVRRVIRRVAPAESGEAMTGPAVVAVATPEIAEPVRAALCARIERSVQAGRSALGLRREVAVAPINPIDEDAIWVLIDDRPAVVVDADARHAEHPNWVDRTARRIDEVLHGRFALLLDDNERAEHAEAICSVTDDDRVDLYHLVPDYLLSNGVSLDRIAVVAKSTYGALNTFPELTTSAVAEVIIDEVAAPTISLEVPRNTIRRASGCDVDQFQRVRVQMYEETGVLFPDIALHAMDADDTPIRLKANDVWLDTSTASAAEWPDVAAGVKSTVRAHVAWFVRRTDVAMQRERLSDAMGSLIELSRATYSDAAVAACLRALVRSRQSVRNLQRMLWSMHDTVDTPDSNAVRFAGLAADVPTDPRDEPESLAARIRARITDEAWRTRAPLPAGPHLALTPEDGDALLSSDPRHCAHTERRVVAACRRTSDIGLLVAPWVAVVAPLRYAVDAMPTPPPVVSMQELPVDASIGTLRL